MCKMKIGKTYAVNPKYICSSGNFFSSFSRFFQITNPRTIQNKKKRKKELNKNLHFKINRTESKEKETEKMTLFRTAGNSIK